MVKIMQTWKNTIIPNKWLLSPESMKTYLSECDYVLLTDDDCLAFVENHFPQYLPIYNNFPYKIQQVDMIRYMWLYIYGGFYFDLDVVLQKPIFHLVYDNQNQSYLGDIFVVKSSNRKSIYTNAIMASKPKCDFWLKVLENISIDTPWWCKFSKNLDVFYSTGPNFLSTMINKYRHIYNIVDLPTSLNKCSVCDNIQECAVNELARPLEGSSWHSWDGWVMNTLLCYHRSILLGIICICLLLFIIYRTLKFQK